MSSIALRRTGALIALILAAAAASSPTGRVLAKAIADPLIHSTSAGAALFALLFVAASLAAPGLRDRTGGPPSGRHAGMLFVAALVAGNAANVAGHLAALETLDLPPRVALYVWSGDENTYSYLFHSHAGKAALTALLGPLATPLGFDVGQAWAGLLPAWVGWVTGAALVTALGAYLRLLPGVVARAGGSRWIAVLFALATLNAVKTIVDGGLLTYRCAPALFIAAALALNDGPASLRRRAPGLVAAFIALVAVYAIGWRSLAPEGSRESLHSFVLVIASLAVPALGAWASGATRGWRRVAPGIAALLVALFWVRDSAATLHALFTPLPAGATALHFDPRSLASEHRAIGGRSASDVYAALGEDPLKPRHVLLLGPEAVTPAPRFPLLVIARGEGPHRAVAVPPWVVTQGATPSSRSDARLLVLGTTPGPVARAFSVEPFLQQNNYYVLLHGLAAELRAAGLRSFVFVPLRDAADLAALRPGA
ncbi:MAG: hypothetical protein U1F14_13605 [Steroidobacteraceae bacterium]